MKPTKEEFKRKYDETEGSNPEKVKKLATHYTITPRTIYRWIDELLNSEPDLGDDFDDEEKSWDEWVNDYRDPDDKYPEYNQKFSINGDALIACISDIHLGSKSLKGKLKKLDSDLKKIKSHKNVFVNYVGDLIDYGPSSPRGLVHDQELKYKNQLMMAKAFVDEIGERIIAMTAGCHSHFTYNVTGDFPEREFAKNTYGGIFMGDGGVVNLKVGDINYKIFMSHKLRGGSKRSPALGLFNIAMESIDFDVGITAHKHTPAVSVRPLRDKQIHMINCGSYKGLDMYARKNGYAPVFNSTPCFYLDSKKKKIISFLNLDEGLEYMEMKKCFTKTHS